MTVTTTPAVPGQRVPSDGDAPRDLGAEPTSRAHAKEARPAEPRAWFGSEEEKEASRKRKVTYVITGTCAGVGLLACFFGWYQSANQQDPWVAILVAGGMLYAALICYGVAVASYGQVKTKFEEREEMFARVTQMRHAADRVDEELTLESVTLLNQSVMDSYHGITKAQAERSFKNSQRAMVAGMTILLAGAIGAVAADGAATKIALAALAGIGTTISGYIGKTFLTAHTAAIAQLNRFFQQPLVNSYLLNA